MIREIVWFTSVAVWVLGSGAVSGIILGRLLIARRAGRVICRQVADVELGLWVITVIGYVAIGAAVMGWRFGVATLTGVAIGESLSLFARRSRLSSAYHVWRRWRYHRPHDVDCEYGHSTSPKARARVAEWRKVAIRPAFGAT